jgi:hypothetical protein
MKISDLQKSRNSTMNCTTSTPRLNNYPSMCKALGSLALQKRGKNHNMFPCLLHLFNFWKMIDFVNFLINKLYKPKQSFRCTEKLRQLTGSVHIFHSSVPFSLTINIYICYSWWINIDTLLLTKVHPSH